MRQVFLFAVLSATLFGWSEIAKGDHLLFCGWNEVFAVDAQQLANGRVKKTWRWKASDRDELPPALRTVFNTTDDCKPIRGGKQILITSSGGGCALVDYPSGQVRWSARVTNAHSIELLPNDRVVVAGSTGTNGNCLKLFDLSRSGTPLWSGPLPSAHGVVWDADRETLWAVGFDELRRYRLTDWKSETPSLTLTKSYSLPDEDGHDLRAVPGTADLVITTHATVLLFDRQTEKFRPHPELKGKSRVKAVAVHPKTGKTVFTQAENPANWWSDTVQSPTPPKRLVLPNERLYKVRWFAPPNADG